MDYKLSDLLDIPRLHRLLDSQYKISRMPSAVIDIDGNILTATAWQEICTTFHRINPETVKRCHESDRYIETRLEEELPYIIYRCQMGLIDAAAPISIEGKHLGNVFAGQLFIDPPDEAHFLAQARQYGFDEHEYLAAMHKVPVFTKEEVRDNLLFLHELVQMQVEHRYNSLLQNEYLEKIRNSEEHHRTILQTAMDGIWLVDSHGRLLEVNDAYCRMSGYSEQELLQMTISQLDSQETTEDTKRRIQGIMNDGLSRFESRHRRKDGTLYDVEVSVEYRSSDGGQCVAFLRDITERKHAAETIWQERALLRSLIDSAADLIYFKDRDGRYLGCNRAAEQFLGIAEQAQLGKSDADFFPTEMAEEIARIDREVFESGAPCRCEDWVTSASGDRQLFDTLKAPIFGKDGQVIGMVGISRDITEKSKMETALHKSKQLFLAIFDASPIPLALIDEAGNITSLNQAFVSTVGYTLDDIPTLDAWWPRAYPDPHYRQLVAEKWQKAVNESARNGSTFIPQEADVCCKDGSVRTFLISAASLEDRFSGTHLVVMYDITGLKKADSDIRNSEARFRTVFERSNIGKSLTAADGTLIQINNAFADMVGYTIEELQEHNFAQITHPDDVAASFALSQYPFTSEQDFLDHALQQVLDLTSSKIGYIYFYSEQNRQFTLNTWSNEVMSECSVVEQQTTYNLDKTGIWGEAVRQRKPILINDFAADNPLKKGVPEGHVVLRRFLTVPVFIGGEIVAVVGVANKESDYSNADIIQLNMFMDAVWKITAYKRAEKEQLNLTEQLYQSQKMESVGRLAGGVAHDFNNMLGVIIGYAEMLLMQSKPGQPLYDSLKEISKAAGRSADLTKQLLAFARKQPVAPRLINLNDTISGMMSMLQRLIGENIRLTWKPGASLCPVKMDPSQMDQILANLCVNSRDAISGTGNVVIETAVVSIDEKYCKYNVYASPGDYVKISFSDDGAGMDKQTTEHIFEPFFTTKGVGEGTGLGLATVYGIVKQNMGFINVYSEPESGTLFTIYLPLYAGSAEQQHNEAACLNLPGGDETVLVVEDEPSILDMTATLLADIGYTVLKASSPGEAISLAVEHADKIDLLITDVIMPDMNGRDLSIKIKAIYPKIKHLFMSGYPADIIAKNSILDEGQAFIQKPFQLSTLAAKLREVLDSDDPMNPAR